MYQSVILKERKGEYLGKTVQVVPHITDEIQVRPALVRGYLPSPPAPTRLPRPSMRAARSEAITPRTAISDSRSGTMVLSSPTAPC